MKICNENKCTGCFSCVNVCPTKSILMAEGEFADLHPVVNTSTCVDCGLCIRTCPNNASIEFNMPKRCYAAFCNDFEKRKFCASGGIGSLICEYAIKRYNAHIFGTKYDEKLNAITSEAIKIEELESFKGSKYVQSIVGEKTFARIKELLDNGEYVVYVATPCQIAGLKAFLKEEFPRLLTVDLICHGVCPGNYLKKEVEFISKKKKLGEITDVRFRQNLAERLNFVASYWKRHNLVYKNSWFYLKAFLLGVTLRESCYECSYAKPKRCSDITIGDFIGLGRAIPYKHSTHNVSSVFANTEKGLSFYERLVFEEKSLISEERDLSERLEYRPSLLEPFPRHKLTPQFRKEYLKYGYVKAIRKTLRGEYMKEKTKKIALLPFRIFRRIFRIVIGQRWFYGKHCC